MANVFVMLLLIGFVMGGIFVPLLGFAGVYFWRLGKAFVVFVDGDGKRLITGYFKPQAGAIRVGNQRFLLDGNAKHGGRYSSWIIGVPNGWNYAPVTIKDRFTFWRAPTRKETFDVKPELAVLEPSNPESYHRAISRLRWTDIIRAGEDPQKYAWVPIVAICSLIGIVMILVAAVVILSKMGSVTGGA